MTITENRAALRTPRTETDLLLDQLRGIDAWMADNTASHCDPTAASRESRLDLARQRDVVERQREALIDWTARQLRESDHVLRSCAAARVVVVHRNEWFKDKVTAGLAAIGVTVVADLENGADAVGVAVAEQPDVVLLENKLPMLPGLDVARNVLRYSPRTAVVAQVESDREIGPFLDAGALTAYTRRIPPGDIVADLQGFLAV